MGRNKTLWADGLRVEFEALIDRTRLGEGEFKSDCEESAEQGKRSGHATVYHGFRTPEKNKKLMSLRLP